MAFSGGGAGLRLHAATNTMATSNTKRLDILTSTDSSRHPSVGVIPKQSNSDAQNGPTVQHATTRYFDVARNATRQSTSARYISVAIRPDTERSVIGPCAGGGLLAHLSCKKRGVCPFTQRHRTLVRTRRRRSWPAPSSTPASFRLRIRAHSEPRATKTCRGRSGSHHRASGGRSGWR